MLGEGVNETFFGTELATTRVGLLLLHDPRNMQPRVMPTRAAPDANLRMSPFLWENESVLENTQCRVCAFFQQLQAGIGRLRNEKTHYNVRCSSRRIMPGSKA